MRSFCLALLLSVGFVAPGFAASHTWTGTISDGMCGAKHMAGEGGMKVSDRECTEMCAKKGAKYVLVTDGKVMPIANQGLAALATFSGDKVTVTGELKNDAVTIATIAKAK